MTKVVEKLEYIARYHFPLEIMPRKSEVMVRVKSTKVARKKRMYFKYNELSKVEEWFKDIKSQAEKKKAKKKKDKKAGKISKKDAIKHADIRFSRYIRERDYYCCTCNRPKDTLTSKTWHCGHCESRQRYNTRRDPKNCSGQCMACNFAPAGKKDLHRKYLDKKRGAGTSKKILKKSKTFAKRSANDIMKIGDKYKKLYEDLINGR